MGDDAGGASANESFSSGPHLTLSPPAAEEHPDRKHLFPQPEPIRHGAIDPEPRFALRDIPVVEHRKSHQTITAPEMGKAG